MIKKYIFGKPLNTESVIKDVENGQISDLSFLNVNYKNDSVIFQFPLEKDDIVYGLGETTSTINKRGGRYISFNTDMGRHRYNTPSLYSSHNFIVIDSKIKFALFIDSPTRVIYEIDYKNSNEVKIICENKNFNLYLIKEDTPYKCVRSFLSIIGHCYIPPLWAFGYGQSRFGYKSEDDLNQVIEGYNKYNLPLDYICMDIDYMDHFKLFTINEDNFKNFKDYVFILKKQGIHLVPIVDVGIKKEDGYSIYEKGKEENCYCKNLQGDDYTGVVWPGDTVFPDMLNEKSSMFFSKNFKFYTDYGIDGFWLDMNEPSIFQSEYSKEDSEKKLTGDKNYYLDNKFCEYKCFYHNVDGEKILHYDVHNIYGHKLAISVGKQLDTLLDKRYMMFTRSSYIGTHRYSGIWTGDNQSRWDHLKMNIHQMPSLNMCGFLYSGADTGGFSGYCTRELLLRWMAFSLFTPLFRNHSSCNANRRECYRFKKVSDFKSILSLRYRLIPYIYSEYVKAALTDDMYFKSLSFEYDDENVKNIDDQLLVGDSLMITPLIEKGKDKRTIYLPEEMTMVKYDGSDFKLTKMEKGNHTISAKLNEVVFFIRKGKLLPIGKECKNTSLIDLKDVQLLGDGKEYDLYIDDGYSKDVSMDKFITLKK